MKIQTSKENRVNLKVQVLDDVTLHFNGERIAELEDESKLEAIMNADPSISVVGKEKPKTEQNPPKGNEGGGALSGLGQTHEGVEDLKESKGTGEKMTGIEVKEGESATLTSDKGETVTLTNDEVGEKVEQDNVTISTSDDKEEGDDTNLSDIKMPDLKELCKESGFPEEEWKSFKKKDDLVAYMEGKLKGE